MSIKARNQQSMTSSAVTECFIGDPVTFSKKQAEPQVLYTNQHWPYPVYKDDQPAASSITKSSDMLQPLISTPKSTKQSCAVLTITQNNLTSSATPIYHNPAISRYPSANTFNDTISQAAPPEQESMTITPASQDLATLLYFLGQSKISNHVLNRARGPRLTWNENGEAVPQDINVAEVVQNENYCKKAIYDLHQLQVIHLEPSTAEPKYFSMDSQLLAQIAHDKDHVRWKSEAVKIVFCAFPMDRRLEPFYSFSIATSILPLLKHVLPFLEEIDIEKALPAAYVIEVCLSASYYSTLVWKRNVITVIENIEKRCSVNVQLSERIALRKRIISRLSSCEWGSETWRPDFVRVDQRSTGYYGDFVLFNANILFGHQQFEAALAELDKYTPWRSGNVSTLEQIQICEMSFLRGKIHHFSGYFKKAKGLLEQIMRARPSDAPMLSKVIAHLSAVCCELGDARLGINYASDQLNDIVKTYHSLNSGSVKRLRLALAYAYLMQGLWVTFNQPTAFSYTSVEEDIQQGFDKAEELFQELVRSYENPSTLGKAGKISRFSALLGLALIAHIKGHLRDAFDYYDMALNAASHCNWGTGYIEAIINWSKSVITHSFGYLEETRKLNELAGSLYQSRSYFFTGFGTLWPEIIGTWVAEQGRERIIPRQEWEKVSCIVS